MIKLVYCIEIKNWSWVDNTFELQDMTAELSAVAVGAADVAGTVAATQTEKADKRVEKIANIAALGCLKVQNSCVLAELELELELELEPELDFADCCKHPAGKALE